MVLVVMVLVIMSDLTIGEADFSVIELSRPRREQKSLDRARSRGGEKSRDDCRR